MASYNASFPNLNKGLQVGQNLGTIEPHFHLGLSEEEQCQQLFFPPDASDNTTYEDHKDQVEKYIKGTCLWFLQHDNFKWWLNQDSGPLLVTADPGCGKSVLAKHLIDEVLPQTATICYYFFKDGVQNTVRKALCALLHQLFSKKPELIQHAMQEFRKYRNGLTGSTNALWTILGNAIKDPQAGPVIIVLDALDECAETEITGLIENIKREFYGEKLGHSQLKYLLTCRPHKKIVSNFGDLLPKFAKLHIPGEEQTDIISEEVNLVIKYRVDQLATKEALCPSLKSHLEQRLLTITHRTYLWVYLVFKYLEEEEFKKTVQGIDSLLTTLPNSVDEAYKQILKKSANKSESYRALSIILAASRPLTTTEMNVAMSINHTSKSIDKLDIDPEESFKKRLRSLCGFFISISQNKIYFLHQTAREFLIRDSALPPPSSIPPESWHHSICVNQAHHVLTEICIRYLDLYNSDDSFKIHGNGEASHSSDRQAFLDYSAENWGAHFRDASIIEGNDSDEAIILPP